MAAVYQQQVLLQSASIPALKHDTTYTITAQQSTTYSGQVKSYGATQSFRTGGSPLQLDKTLIDSVYPPPGLADQWYTLAHVAFKDAQVPWTYPNTTVSNASRSAPYLALIVCRDEDLSYDDAFQSDLSSSVTPSTDSAPFEVSHTKALRLSYKQYIEYTKETRDPVPVGDAQIIFLSKQLYASFLNAPQDPSLLAHVRESSVPGSAAVSVVVSSRTGPGSITAPTVVHAHLVALPDLSRNDSGRARCALVSLYSWSYSCLPTGHFNLVDAFRTLGSNVAPLRCASIPDASSLSGVQQHTAARALAGYSPARYVPFTGETLLCIYRGALSPIEETQSVKASNSGGDLAVADSKLGLLDLTFQIAWELGRTLSMANPNVSAAVMRLRGSIHKHCLSSTKCAVDAKSSKPVFRPMTDTLRQFQSTVAGLSQLASSTVKAALDVRWQTSALQPSTRSLLSFNGDSMRKSYLGNLQDTANKITAPVNPMIMSSDSSPALVANMESMSSMNMTPSESTDFTTLIDWISDARSLKPIPWQNLMSDSVGFLPQESIRTFYVDLGWMDAFIDGALSVGEHFTAKDDARECIKHCLGQCLSKMHAPVPRWGFFIRSEVVTKFPDLNIIAPWPATNPPTTTKDRRPQVLRSEQLDKGIRVVLFDRVPNEGQFPEGISICPPGHQLRFQFGSVSSWTFDDNGDPTALQLDLRKISWTEGGHTMASSSTSPLIYKTGDTSYNFDTGILNTASLAKDIVGRVSGGDSTISSALFASQLLASTPVVTLPEGSTRNNGSIVHPLISSTRVTDARNIENTTRPSSFTVASTAQPLATPRVPYGQIPRPTAPARTPISIPIPPAPSPFNGAMPFLCSLANTNFTDTSLISKYLSADDSGPQATLAPGSSGSPCFKIQLYNTQCLISPLTVGCLPLYQNPKRRHLYTALPFSMLLPTDLYIDITVDGAQAGAQLDELSFAFPAGAMGTFLLPPYAPGISFENRPPISPLPNEDLPHRYTHAGTQLPKIDLVGPAKRFYTATLAWQPTNPSLPPERQMSGTLAASVKPRLNVFDGRPANGPSTLTLAVRDQVLQWRDPRDRTGMCSQAFSWKIRMAGQADVDLKGEARVFAVDVTRSCGIMGRDNLGAQDS